MIHQVPLVVTRNIVVGRGRRRRRRHRRRRRAEQRRRRVGVDRRTRGFVVRVARRRRPHHRLAVGLLCSASKQQQTFSETRQQM